MHVSSGWGVKRYRSLWWAAGLLLYLGVLLVFFYVPAKQLIAAWGWPPIAMLGFVLLAFVAGISVLKAAEHLVGKAGGSGPVADK
jgi:ATP/ADP translocase